MRCKVSKLKDLVPISLKKEKKKYWITNYGDEVVNTVLGIGLLILRIR
jgi:hypothetical protein